MKYPQWQNGISPEIHKNDKVMKRVLLVLSLILAAFFNVMAAEQVIHSYIYHDFKVYDRNYNLIEEIPSKNGDPMGLFLVAEIDGETYLSATVGKETGYEFKIVLSKQINDKNGTHADVYAGSMSVEGQTKPLQVFVCYSKSLMPDVIVVDVFNSPTLIELSGLVKAGH